MVTDSTNLDGSKEIQLKTKVPYGEFGLWHVFLVDPDEVQRKTPALQDFDNYGTPAWYKGIPRDEIWIDQTLGLKEQHLFLTHAMIELREMSHGKTRDQAYAVAEKKQKAEREVMDGIRFDNTGIKFGQRIPAGLFPCAGDVCQLSDGTHVRWVDGNVVRDSFNTDFAEGGNPQVYPFVPVDQIWIEKNDKAEMPEAASILLHEFVERELIWELCYEYEKAHEIANKVGFRYHDFDFSKKKVALLTKGWALSEAKCVQDADTSWLTRRRKNS